MKLYFIFFLIVILSNSCKELYNPEVDTDSLPLVVDALITDEPKSYTVKLFTASKFNNNSLNQIVINADVTVSDDCGGTYKFTETKPGVYVSNPAEFIGQPGRTYTLSVTSGSNTYTSNPQLLLPNYFDVNTYAELGSREQLVDNGIGRPYKETVQGVNLLVDIQNNTDSLPRFRFVHTTHNEYMYTIQVSAFTTYRFYCWQLINDNDLANLSEQNYQTSEKSLEKHVVCFIPKIEVVSDAFEDSTIQAYVSNQISKISQYRINNETYQYYKNINSLLSANGKMFDPTAFQLKGNMHCVSNSNKDVLGFFEASSVRTSYYVIKPGSKVVSNIKSFEPPSVSGCIKAINTAQPPSTSNPPDFWVY